MQNKNGVLNPVLAKKPVLDDQPVDLIRTRRNLLLITSIYLFCYICEVTFIPKFFNENFLKGELTETNITWAITILILYLFISFLWKFNDFYHSQNILSTKGINIYSVMHFGDVTEKETFRSPGQYSLAAWWARTSEIMDSHYERIEKTLENFEVQENVRSQVDKIKADTQTIASMYKAASNDDVINTLSHFDKSVIRFVYTQRLRIFIIDWCLPVFMSTVTLGLLTGELLFIATLQ